MLTILCKLPFLKWVDGRYELLPSLRMSNWLLYLFLRVFSMNVYTSKLYTVSTDCLVPPLFRINHLSQNSYLTRVFLRPFGGDEQFSRKFEVSDRTTNQDPNTQWVHYKILNGWFTENWTLKVF